MRHLIAATAVAAVLVTGCGPSGDDDVVAEPPTEEAQPEQSQPEQSQPEIELTVEASQGGAESTTWRLRCEPTGGDHPDAAAACGLLQDIGAEEAFAPVPKDTQCTMIYGGPQVATVTGHWGDDRVDARFDRTNGCEISRWKSLVPLLPKV